MILVDSSCWIELLTGGTQATQIDTLIQQGEVLIPTLVLYEVYRQLIKKIDEEEALLAVTQLDEMKVVPLDSELSLYAAELSLKHKLGTADAVIYATALAHQATVVTFDNDFRSLPHCRVID